MILIDSYEKEEFKRIVLLSTSWSDLAKRLGYKSVSGDLVTRLRKRVEEDNVDIAHFKRVNSVIRTEENVFIENSTVNQSTLRRWYIKGKYTAYKCSICGQLPIWNNKDLTLILDHINGINNDDRLENLRWVCPNCNQQLDTTGGKNPQRKHHIKKYYCIDCGKEISAGSMRCVDCYSKSRIISEKEMQISREELKALIRTTPFTTIGKQYGVSDNAVRKWCKKLNLPSKSSEIKKYNDKDWTKI